VVNPGTYYENDVLNAGNNGLSISAASAGVTLVGAIDLTNASGIAISGLTFQGNGSNVAISALDSQNITVTDNSFLGTGEAVVFDGTTASTASDNLMNNTTASAIEGMDGANNDVFDSNKISGDSAQNTVGAIYLHGSNDTSITHNQITNTTGAGISLDDFEGPGTTATQNNNDTIADNSLSGVDTGSSDSGAIYILGRSQNSLSNDLVKMNFIGATGGAPNVQAIGIYLDDNASGVTATQNIIQATPYMDADIEIHGGSNNSFSGNIVDTGTGYVSFALLQSDQPDQQPQGSFSQLQNDTITHNIFVSESTSPRNPGFADLTNGIGDVSISANDFWSFAGAQLLVAGSGASGDSNPTYVAPAAQAAQTLANYSTWSGAGINFQAIDTSHIGLDPSGPHPY
jgi:parallel beta-helix repeat protein